MSFPLSPAQLKAMIVATVGDTGSGVVAANIDNIYTMFTEKATIHPLLQYYYALREALTMRTIELASKVNVRIGGMMIDYAASAERLQPIKAEVSAKIAEFENASPSSASAAAIIRTAPVQGTDPYLPNPTGYPTDANDPIIQGNPYIGTVYPLR